MLLYNAVSLWHPSCALVILALLALVSYGDE